MGGSEAAASIRTRAELARRLASELKDPSAVKALEEIADALDADADNLENNLVPLVQKFRPSQPDPPVNP